MAGCNELFGFEAEPDYADVAQWAVQTPIVLEGGPFSFQGHEYLLEPYRDRHPYQVEQKATQMGCTVKALLKAFYAARYQGFKRAILYYFPTRTDVSEFSKGRAAPLIEDNPTTLERWVRDTDATHIKRVANCFIYFRGMKSMAGLKSTPADMVIFDELDEAPPAAMTKAMKRMAHSEFGYALLLSNPTLPDYGISKEFDESDQRFWLLKCGHCGHWTCLEDTFPDCLLEVNSRVIRACERCRGELDPAAGEWVAKKPKVEVKRGRHYSQLFSLYVPPAAILHEYRTTRNLRDFTNLVLGLPYIEAENRLSVEEVLALCGDEGIASSDPGPCFMGVDQGRDLHVVIGKRHWQRAGKVVHLGIYRDWEELDRLMQVFNVSRCVVDGLPETRNARAFAYRFQGKVFLNFYQDHRKGEYAWNEGDLTVACNRTESLDASHGELKLGPMGLVLPRECDIVREYAKHLHNVGKELEEDERTGSKRYVYVKLGEDHFRHATNYEAMARQYGQASVFGGLDLS